MNKRKTFQLHQRRAKQRTEFRQREDNLDRSDSREPGNFQLPDIIVGGGPCQHPCGSGTIIEDCPDVDCTDTFTRTLANTWGNSEIRGLAWLPTSASDLDVDGDAGTISGLGINGFRKVSLDTNDLIESESVFEILILAKFDQLVSNIGGTIRAEQDDTPSPYNFIQMSVTTTNILRLTIQSPTLSDSVDILTGVSEWDNVELYFRARWDKNTNEMNGKVWKASESEPAAWSLTVGECSTDWTGWEPSLFFINGSTASAFVFYIKEYTITEGLNCASTNIDTFSRTTTASAEPGQGLGISEINGGHWAVGGVGSAYCDGSVARTLDSGNTNTTHSWNLWGSDLVTDNPTPDPVTLADPFDAQFKCQFNHSSHELTLWVGRDDGYVQIDLSVVSGDLQLRVEAWDGFNTESDTGNGPSGIVGDQFWVRLQGDTDGIRGRAWLVGDTEPSTWQAEATGVDVSTDVGDLVEVQFWITDPDASTHMTIDDLTFNLLNVGCSEEIHSQDGGGTRIVIEGDPDLPPTGGVYSQTVLGVCTRVNGTTYTTPTSAASVINVTLDGQDVIGWVFISPTTITLPASVDADSRVYARYVME